MRIAIVLTVVATFAFSGFGATIYVPDDYTTIQGAIDASLNGDTIIVRPGTYPENIDFLGKAITVSSSHGPDVTIIDGGSPIDPNFGSVVSFVNDEEQDSVIDGFTLTNGTGTANLVLPPYPLYGGGVCIGLLGTASPTVKNNWIHGNTAIYGGGIHIEANGTGTMPPIITGNIISNNVSLDSGGGISCYANVDALITNNIISKNASNIGGGIECFNAQPIIINNTIVSNTAATYGGGIRSVVLSNPKVKNTIIRGNWAPVGPDICLTFYAPLFGSDLQIEYSDVTGGQPAVFVDTKCNLLWGAGMIDAVPNFVDAANDDYHIYYNSPCKDGGSNAAVMDSTDFETDLRIAEGTVDIGADEFYPHFYLTGDITPNGAIKAKFVGIPGTKINGLLLGFNIFDPPLPCDYGLWYMNNPFQFFTGLGQVPPSGVLAIPGVLPPAPPAPYTVYLQGAIDYWLTNLFPMNVN